MKSIKQTIQRGIVLSCSLLLFWVPTSAFALPSLDDILTGKIFSSKSDSEESDPEKKGEQKSSPMGLNKRGDREDLTTNNQKDTLNTVAHKADKAMKEAISSAAGAAEAALASADKATIASIVAAIGGIIAAAGGIIAAINSRRSD